MIRRILRYVRSNAQNVLFATATFVPLAKTESGPLSTLYSTNDLPSFINGLFKFAIIIGAIAAVLRIAYAGYLYMGQSDMWSRKGEAKKILGDVILGLLLLLSIYIILNQINPDILKLKALDVISNNPVPAAQSELLEDRTTRSGNVSAPAVDEEGEILNSGGGVGKYYYDPQPGQYCYEAASDRFNYFCAAGPVECNNLAIGENMLCTKY